jgi:regulator of PEP synthase PpsR (kinase-PPPase family)
MSIRERTTGPPIFVVSGGTGASGELLVRTVLAQFRDVNVPIVLKPHVHEVEQVDVVVGEAADAGAAIVHTMVNAACRLRLLDRAHAHGVVAFDLAAPLMGYLEGVLRQEPTGQPGLYRQLHRAYFDRVAAIEFAVAHDDGKRPEDLPQAEIVVTGVSRVGKTPLSMYLSILGWKVANVPFVPGVPMPDEMAQVDSRRVVALMVEPAQLLSHRRWRQQRTGIPAGAYVDRSALVEELRAARHYYAAHGFPVVDATDKPIETCADEVVTLVSRRMGQAAPALARATADG